MLSHSQKLLAVLGSPIKHSLSPKMHNHALQRLNLNSFYTRFYLPQDISAHDLREFILSGDIDGVNITLPFKERAFMIADKLEDMASQIGAINTIVRQGNTLIGYNTDSWGFYHSIKHYNPRKVLLLGAGGSARSIALILAHHNIALTIANRTATKLEPFRQFGATLSYESLAQQTEHYDIIVNATSASIANALPLSREVLTPLLCHAKLAYDLMYQDDDTPFCALAKQCHTPTLDGKIMLIYQGVLALLHFHNIEYNESEFQRVASYMAEALDVSLGDSLL